MGDVVRVEPKRTVLLAWGQSAMSHWQSVTTPTLNGSTQGYNGFWGPDLGYFFPHIIRCTLEHYCIPNSFQSKLSPCEDSRYTELSPIWFFRSRCAW